MSVEEKKDKKKLSFFALFPIAYAITCGELLRRSSGKRAHKKKKKKLNGLDIYVIFSIIAMVIYTIVSQIICVACSNEYTLMTMDTLTTCFFGFFGGEIVTCALIKIFKLKGNKSNDGGAVG